MGQNETLFQKPETVNTFTKKGRDVTSTLAPYTGSMGLPEIKHLLKRTMFGAAIADINYFTGKTLNQIVTELLNPTAPLPAPPVKEYADNSTPPYIPDGLAPGASWANHITNDGAVQGARMQSYRKWQVGNVLNQDRSIREKMTLFWLNHFGTEIFEIGIGNFGLTHNMLLRQNALGNFKNLVKQVTTDCCMLRYLNGYINIATAPDENFARELQELFTIGKGPDSHYTESDVKEAAKLLTGFRINYTTQTSFFSPTLHSSVNKTFSAFYNNTVITGRTGATAGNLELDDLLNMLFANAECAKNIMRKVYRWFVYYEIDAATEANIITPLADIFRNNNYEIKPCLDVLFKSQHFFDMQNRGCIIKSPLDLVIGGFREFGTVFPALTPTSWTDTYGLWNYVASILSNMQQDMHNPPNVSGWPAYYQAPKYHEMWVNIDTLQRRNLFTDAMIGNGYTLNGKKIFFDPIAFVKLLPNPSDPNAIIKDFDDRFFGVRLSDVSRAQIKVQILLSNQTSDYYWTNAWNAYIANPTTANFNIVNTRLKELFKYFMNLAEYQLS
jgi:hypothetical protein